MDTPLPVIVSLAVVGALAGMFIAGRDPSVDTIAAGPAVTASFGDVQAPSADGADAPSTTVLVASEPVAPTTTDPAATTTTVDPAGATTTIDTTVPPENAPDVTLDIPIGPVDTADIPTVPTVPDQPTPEEPPPVTPANLRVVIADADSRVGLDDIAAQRLADLGYQQVTVAADVPQVEFTTVYFREGFNRAAVNISIDLGASNVSLQPMPTDGSAPITTADAAGDVIVLLGPDLPT